MRAADVLAVLALTVRLRWHMAKLSACDRCVAWALAWRHHDNARAGRVAARLCSASDRLAGRRP